MRRAVSSDQIAGLRYRPLEPSDKAPTCHRGHVLTGSGLPALRSGPRGRAARTAGGPSGARGLRGTRGHVRR